MRRARCASGESSRTRRSSARPTRERIQLVDTLRRERAARPVSSRKSSAAAARAAQFGWGACPKADSKVYTTIDPEMQRAAEGEREASVKQIEVRRSRRKDRPDRRSTGSGTLCRDGSDNRRSPRAGRSAYRDYQASAGSIARDASAASVSRDRPLKPFHRCASALEAGYSPAASLVTRASTGDRSRRCKVRGRPEDEHALRWFGDDRE